MKALRRLSLCLAAALLPAFSALRAAGPELPAARDPFSGAALVFPDFSAVQDPLEVPAERIYYFAPWEADVSAVPPAPVPGSAADRRDLAELLRWQNERTEAQCAAAWLQADATYDAFFGAITPFASPAPKEVASVFGRVRVDTASVVYLLKKKYQRPRPYERDLNFLPCVEREGSYAYPSGHSAVARVFALMLSELVPARAGQFMAYADQAALNRVIGGVHHPTDTVAGKLVGDAAFAALKKVKSFRSDMDVLRRHLRH